VAVNTNNVISFAALAGKRVDVTAIGKDGLSPLHVVVSKIKEGSGDISLLRLWVESGLPTNNGYFPTKGDKVARPSAFKVVFIWLVAVLTCPI
jgi:hypothetical protein